MYGLRLAVITPLVPVVFMTGGCGPDPAKQVVTASPAPTALPSSQLLPLPEAPYTSCPATLPIGAVGDIMELGTPPGSPELGLRIRGAISCSYPRVYAGGLLARREQLDASTAHRLLERTQRQLTINDDAVHACGGASAFTLLIIHGENGRTSNIYYPENGCIEYVAVANLGVFPLKTLPTGLPTAPPDF